MKKIFETPLYPYERPLDLDSKDDARHVVAIIGAGPVGLSMAVDLAQYGIKSVVFDDNDKVSFGSRAICFAKRTLEIADRYGFGDRLVDKGVVWNHGKVFFDERKVYDFNLLPESGHRRPAFINLQQYYYEEYLVDRARELAIDIRGKSKVTHIDQTDEEAKLLIETPDGSYGVRADWVIACDGAGSPTRSMMGLSFTGRVFEDNFLIADVVMDANFPTERWFWFDPPFNRGQSALLHKQPDSVWRIDLQLGPDVDKDEEAKPENVIPRLKAMLGDDVNFDLEWVSVYSFQCRRMEKFRHGRVFFAGDSAHQVSPFGARGANSGVQDVDNLSWKLAAFIQGHANDALLESYNDERVHGADENIINSSRSTDFITPKSEVSRLFRNAVLDLSERFEFARPLVNSGRLSVPCVYDGSLLNGVDHLEGGPHRSRPGSSCPDLPIGDGFLLDHLGGSFTLLSVNTDIPDEVDISGLRVESLQLECSDLMQERYLGAAQQAVYLIRPDQHVVARWPTYDEISLKKAVRTALGHDV